MKSYYRIMAGKGGQYAALCREEGYIGTDFDPMEDLTGRLPEDLRAFNRAFVPIVHALHPEKSKIAIGLWCGFLWTVSKGIKVGDIVLSPDGMGRYLVGEVMSDYFYVPGGVLPHRRKVRWADTTIARDDVSEALRNSMGSIGTVSNITRYHDELEALFGQRASEQLHVPDPMVEDPVNFALERHLEDFLCENWAQTELGRTYDILEVDGELVGRQFQSDTGPMDILAISKDRRELMVVELKKGRASDGVVGQVLRYMGYVQEELAEAGQSVAGVIIALEDDQKIRRALAMVPSITFYRYEIRFKLVETQR
jgi:restriction system protein